MDDNQNPNPWQSPGTRDPKDQHEPRQHSDPGARRPNFDTVMDAVRKLMGEYRSTLLSAWGVYAAVWLMTTLVISLGSSALGMDPASQQQKMESLATSGDPLAFFEMFGAGYWVLLGVSVVVGFVQVGVGVSTFAAVRRAWLDGRNLSMAEVVGEMGRRIGAGALLYLVFTILFMIGAVLCCIPGLLVGYFMLPTFYLVGGRGDGIFDSVSRGFELAKRHVALFFILIGLTFAVVLMMACIGGASTQIVFAVGEVGYLLSQLVSWFFGVFFGFFIWVYYAGTMICIEQSEDASVGW